MANWKLRIERWMVEIASGDDLKMERMQEIISWFAEEKQMKAAAASVFRRLTKAEDVCFSPLGMPVGSLKALLWAMEEAESDNPRQAMKWKAFRSRRRAPPGPTEMVVGAMMALLVPGSATLPIIIEPDVEPEAVVEAEEVVAPLARSSRTKEVVHTPRRSPRFPRRSPRLLSLTRSAVAE